MDNTDDIIEATMAHVIKTCEAKVQQAEQDKNRANFKPHFFTEEEFSRLMLEAENGFIIVISGIGKILYVSGNVTSLLGYLPVDIMNRTIYDLMPIKDTYTLGYILNCHPEPGTQVEHTLTLSIRLGSSESYKYQMVNICGNYKRCDPIPRGENIGSKCIFVCIGRVPDSKLDLLKHGIIKRLSFDSISLEFCSKHSIEWEFMFVDDRATPIIGYTIYELFGMSIHRYVHSNDVQKLASSHEQLKRKGVSTSCFHRFQVKDKRWVWLQSRYRIINNRRTSKPESITCIHRVLSDAEVTKHFGSRPSSSSQAEIEHIDPVLPERYSSLRIPAPRQISSPITITTRFAATWTQHRSNSLDSRLESYGYSHERSSVSTYSTACSSAVLLSSNPKEQVDELDQEWGQFTIGQEYSS